MRILFKFLKVAFVALPLLAMRQDKPLRVIFFGDSITQAGVSPTGYITKMTEMLKAQGKESQYELMGAGIGGNKVYDLYLRLEDDVLSKKPDVVFIYVGINDVWHKTTYGTGTDPDKYVKFYEALIKKMKAQNIRVIVCTPTVIGERNDASNPQDGDLNYYSRLIREIATRNNLQLCDLRKYFQDYLAQNNPKNEEKGILTTDRVHLTDNGNKFLAEKMMEALVQK
ncbi:SGNH/GDSL hydrolase family protein [Dyadobacter sediminis]|uniref:G-D-S-L family lipolytic protein n=1 Tax=Dyadobacter sediminis TaxID=1493691 RepID=A0A5R9KDP0_9BACT|nr:SGNH/GDSL hydrolase family protein [Dyadobacter sediminis]TLU94176.1 G-D-S-L family lipolytic protein [Dyadobacter sediminis]GGB93575.1 lysophospholipase [Dyadobacter sediminis]